MSRMQSSLPFSLRGGMTLRRAISRVLLGSSASLFAAPLVAADIEEIVVVDRARDNYLEEQSSLGKFTEALLDTPQSITVLTEGLLEDRGASSLSDALRNVPGITLGAGEMSWQGNTPFIRGFNSRNDMYLDGMRDFGSYYRDPFSLESIEVLQGPSSMAFGRGSTGGVINQTTRLPREDELRSLHLNMGNADTRRVVADLNQPFDDGMAARVNLMYHEGEVPERDGAHSERYGFAPSLSMELGDATRFTLNYMMMNSDDVPDYGLPWLAGRPVDVDRETYYGFADDYIATEIDVATARIDHELGPSTRVQALVRWAKYDRSSRLTEPQFVGTPTATTPLDQIVVRRFVFQGESTEDIVQGQLNVISEFSTGNIDHALVTGIEIAQEGSDPTFGFPQGVPDTTLLDPGGAYSQTASGLRVLSDSTIDTLAGFVLDTVKFNPQWQLLAGARWDRFEIDYDAQRFTTTGAFDRNESIAHTDIETSWRLALVYKPVEIGTIYLGGGTSFNPSGEGLSFINSGRNLTIGDSQLDPEQNRSIELGTKWELLDSALVLDAAVYRVEKTNARVPDPTTPGFNILAGEQSVKGFSVNAVGRLGRGISVTAGFTHLDSEQGRSTQAALVPGTALVNVPEVTFSGWLNYALTQRLEVGLGARYVDERLATNTQPVKAVPDYWAYDAMAKFEASDTLTFKLNLTNFTDEYYFDQLHAFHVVPGPGLGAVFAIHIDY